MIISPVQNTAVQNGFPEGGSIWVQRRPRITQGFGENPDIYAQFGLKGHNGIDFGGIGNDNNIFAPMTGYVKVKDSGNEGYGLHIRIRDGSKEIVLGHLSQVNVLDGMKVNIGDLIGVMGNTGFSTGTHLHLGLRYTEGDGAIWSRPVKDYANGYLGYVDPEEYIITWKGSLTKNTL